jgi:hypothetical protein
VFADAPAELRRVIEASRLGNHAPTLRWFAKLRAGGSAPADDAEARARRMFPNTTWS